MRTEPHMCDQNNRYVHWWWWYVFTQIYHITPLTRCGVTASIRIIV